MRERATMRQLDMRFTVHSPLFGKAAVPHARPVLSHILRKRLGAPP